MILGLLLVLGCTAARADEAAFAHAILADVQREDTPWRGAPIVVVTAHPTGCASLLTSLASAIQPLRPTFTVDYAGFTSQADVWKLKGPDVGYLGSDQPTPLEGFLRTHGSGTVLLVSDGRLKAEVTLAPWLWSTLTRGHFESPRGDVPINAFTFVIEMDPRIEVRPGVTLRTLVHSAEASGADGPFRYHVLRRLMAQAKLRTAVVP